MASRRIPLFIRVAEKELHKNGLKRFYASAAAQPADTAAAAKAKKMDRKPEETKSFCMNLFRGQAVPDLIFPFPEILDAEQTETLSMVIGPTEKFLNEVNDPMKNDEDGFIPREFLLQFGELGGLGAVVPTEYEGAGLNNTQMARLAEVVGANDLALGVTMGAHQSIGYKGILLYGSEEQKKKYLPDLATGRKFASFCLTEPSCGSDANSIRSRAELNADGTHYILNGSKIWITNAGFADVFTVFAQTPVKTEDGVIKDKVSAFVVERKYGGITNGPPEKKMGIKGSNTAELYFDNVKIPKENLLGGEGHGFKVAMNILNNGRFGIPAAMTGCMRFCIQKAIEHATTRSQFGRKIETYGTIQEKIATMISRHYVTESVVYMLSGTMDNGVMDYQLEGAIGKIVGSENAWYVCDEAIQILAGMGFMKEAQLERVLRDIRIFRIFEGTNDILRLFIALTGLQYAGGHLRELAKAIKNPAANLGLVMSEATKRGKRAIGVSSGPSFNEHVHPSLQGSAKLASVSVEKFGMAVESLLRKHGKNIIEQQFLLNRLANSAIDIFSMATVLSRATRSINQMAPSAAHETLITEIFCREASGRVDGYLGELKSSQRIKDYEGMAELARQVFKNQSIVTSHPLGV